MAEVVKMAEECGDCVGTVMGGCGYGESTVGLRSNKHYLTVILRLSIGYPTVRLADFLLSCWLLRVSE